MITITEFRDKKGVLYAMRFKGSFLKTIDKIQVELCKGSLLIKTTSINPETDYKVDMTGKVRKMLYRQQLNNGGLEGYSGRVH